MIWLETLVVALIVGASLLFSAWRLTPARYRPRAIDRLAPAARNGHGWLGRLRQSSLAELSGGGCGACSHNRLRELRRR